MRKVLLTIAVLVGMTAGAMMLSAFATPKQDAKAESSQVSMTADDWQIIRENVPYCDGEKDVCMGYGYVWYNEKTQQYAFSIAKGGTKFNLTVYTGKEGYNCRFWYDSKKTYYYVSI